MTKVEDLIGEQLAIVSIGHSRGVNNASKQTAVSRIPLDDSSRGFKMSFIFAAVNTQKVGRLAWNAAVCLKRHRGFYALRYTQLLGRECIAQERDRTPFARPQVA